MNKKRITTIFIVLLLGFGLYRSHTATVSSVPHTETGYMIGTVVNITVYGDYDDDIFDKSFDIIRDIESKMSLNIDTSELNEINANAGIHPVAVSESTFDVIERSLYHSKVSDGAFDISAGSLVSLWQIGSDKASIPPAEALADAIDTIDYKNIWLNRDSLEVFLKEEGMIIDVGGIAKGYAADRVGEYLSSRGVERAIVDAGGDIYLLGKGSNGGPWKIGVKDPFTSSRNDYLGIVSATQPSIVTSGVYERFLEIEGDDTVYHHILDPKTGYPVQNDIQGVTIVSDSTMDSDGFSTSVFVLGLEEGMKLVESTDNVEAIFVMDSKEVYVSSGLRGLFELTSDEFTMAEL